MRFRQMSNQRNRNLTCHNAKYVFMPKTIHILFTNKTTSESSEFQGEIHDREWSVLLRFKQYAEELAPVLREGIAVEYNFNLDREKGVSTNSTLPSEVQSRAFLHSMRPFVLQEEETYFLTI